MTRKPNKKTERAPMGILIQFTPGEMNILKHNEPGPSGLLGGMARMENWVVANTRPNRKLVFDGEHFIRLINYLKNYGDGGPNGHLRATCIPALGRIGIIVIIPGWGGVDQTKGDDE